MEFPEFLLNFAIRHSKKFHAIQTFQALPQITPFNFGEDEEINLDEAVAVTCIVTKGDLPIHIWWTLKDEFSDTKNLTTNDGVVITRNGQKVSVLTIEAVKSRHRGNYTCHAMNKAGIAGHSAFLQINGEKLYQISKIFPFLQFVSQTKSCLRLLAFLSAMKN